jgi:zinc-binding in reverse transcriptase
VINLQEVPKQNTFLPNMLIWKATKDGKYSVNSGYKSLMEAMSNEVENVAHPYWREIWDLDVIPRVKIFPWKVGCNALPVLAALHRRMQNILPLCQICGMEDETIRHMIFDCSFARAVWFSSPYKFTHQISPLMSKGRYWSCYQLQILWTRRRWQVT